MSERCLVTGGAGFIGSHLVDRLLQEGHQVTVYDDLSLGRRAHLAGALAAGARLVVADLLDLERLATELPGHQQVWHLAASSDIRRGTTSTRLDLEQGTLATHNVLEAMRRCGGAARLVFASSSVVYGEPTLRPTPEDHGPLQPISLYGAAKLAAEGLISAHVHSHGLQATIFRFANVVGPRSTHGILFDLARKLRDDPRRLEVLGDGTQTKSYLTVHDCVDAMLHVVRRAGAGLGVYNLACRDSVSVRRIAEMVVQHWTAGQARIHFTGGDRGWTGDVPRMLLDPSRLEALGWKARHTSEQAIELAIRGINHAAGSGGTPPKGR